MNLMMMMGPLQWIKDDGGKVQ